MHDVPHPDQPLEPLEIPIVIQYGDKIYHTLAMIDCGASNSFINAEFVGGANIPQVPREIPLPVNVVDGRPIASGQITHHTTPVQLQVCDHQETLVLDITSLGDHHVILGCSWLSKHNPVINWVRPSIKFSSMYCMKNCDITEPFTIPVLPAYGNLASKSAPDTPLQSNPVPLAPSCHVSLVTTISTKPSSLILSR
jgi:hypothetical protein